MERNRVVNTAQVKRGSEGPHCPGMEFWVMKSYPKDYEIAHEMQLQLFTNSQVWTVAVVLFLV